MKRIFSIQALAVYFTVVMLTLSANTFAQGKNSAKAEAELKKAVEAKGQEKQEHLTKAFDLYDKDGVSKEEAYSKIGDALLDAKDYTGATSYYGRAGKDAKKEGFKKLGDAYLADAGTDPKNEAKMVKKAIDSYTKAGDLKAGQAKAGDYYFAKGTPESLTQAMDYYEQGGAVNQLNKIADDFYAKGPESYAKAAAAYDKTGDATSQKKAGDIYWGLKDYEKAYASYDKANNMEGIKKYADRLHDAGQFEAANAQYNKIADYYVKTKNSEGLGKLASNAFDGADYGAAAMYYEKMADTKNAEKAHSYESLFAFDFEGAAKHFDAAEDQAMAAAIKANLKTLQTLPAIVQEFDQIKSNEPYVGMDSNSVVGQKVPNVKDQVAFKAYYKGYISSVTDKVFALSAAYAKLTDPTLKKVVKQKFLRYGAVRNLLNNDTFTKKKEKTQVKTEDVVM